MLKLERFFVSEQLKPVLKLGQQAVLTSRKSCCRIKPQMNTLTTILSAPNVQNRLCSMRQNSFHTDFTLRKKIKDEGEAYDVEKSLMYYKDFECPEKKDKTSFLDTVRMYKENAKNRASHVDFIKAALKHMKDYGVHRDLECYKSLINVLPKGVYVCTNNLMADGIYYPRQQYVAMELLEQMETFGCLPDKELGIIYENIFGARAHPTQRYYTFLYWSTKIKNKSPFILPEKLPTDPIILAKLAIERITSVDAQTEISVFKTDGLQESIDKTWIVSAQSPKQRKLLTKHPKNVPAIVEGGDMVYLRGESISYFILKADGEPLPLIPQEDISDTSNLESKYFNPNYLPKQERSVHEQDDGIIYAVCATGTSSRDSLLSWVRILENTGNSVLADVPILFRFRKPEKLPVPFSEEVVLRENTKT